MRMSKHIVRHSTALTDEHTDQIRYAIESLLSEGSKFIMLWLAFSAIDRHHLFLVSFFIFSMLRILSGGFHFNGYWSCLLGSFVAYLSILLLVQHVEKLQIAFLIIALLAIHRFTPVYPQNRPVGSMPLRRFLTALAIAIMFIFFLSFSQLQIYITTVFVFSVQLSIGGIKNEKLV